MAGDVIREHRHVGTRARRATTGDIDELIRLAAVMLAAMGHDPSPADWRAAARDLLPLDFEAESKAAFVVDHPDGGGRSSPAPPVRSRNGSRRCSTPMAAMAMCNGLPQIRSSAGVAIAGR